MPEEIQTGQIGEESQTQQPTGEGQQPAAMPTAQEPQVQADGALPDAVSERTKVEFEKLKEHNKKLAEENSRLKQGGQQPASLLDSYMLGSQPPAVMMQQPQTGYAQVSMPQMQNLSQAQVEQVKKEIVDAEGYLDSAELDRRLKLAEEAERQAKAALEQARSAQERIARFEVDAEVRDLYREFPELDPSSDKFSDEAVQLVGSELIAQLARTGRQSGKEAARRMSKYFRKPEPTVTPQQQQTLEQRSQAVAGSVSGTPSALDASEFDELRQRSLHDAAAMDERIRRAGI